ncbi:hypothetical protein LXL04_038067 [Taraxacum kok-saghyz]
MECPPRAFLQTPCKIVKIAATYGLSFRPDGSEPSKPSDHGQSRDGETQTRASHRIYHDPKDYLAPGVNDDDEMFLARSPRLGDNSLDMRRRLIKMDLELPFLARTRKCEGNGDELGRKVESFFLVSSLCVFGRDEEGREKECVMNQLHILQAVMQEGYQIHDKWGSKIDFANA